MLLDKGQNYRVGFPGSGRADDHRSPERIDKIDPALMLFPFLDVARWQVNGVFIGFENFLLRKVFIFQVEAVLHQINRDQLGDIVKADIQEDKANKC